MGIKKVFVEEQNFRLQIIAGAVVLILARYLEIKIWELIVLILLISLVLILELFNSIMERLMDIFKPRLHSYVMDIKDIMAGAVLLAAICSIIIGLIIFIPYLFRG